VVAAGLLVAATLACSEGLEGVVEMTSVQRFEPDTITVTEGEPVVFVNKSDEAHTVTANDKALPQRADYFASGGFESEADARANPSDGFILEDETYSVEFDRPGTYEYFCIPHESSGMRGSIVVER
jgi:plastocyanin